MMELNKAVLVCMRELRKRLRAEQQVDIHLNQADAIPAMLAACMNSTDEETRRLGRELAVCTNTDLPPPPSPTPVNDKAEHMVRIYRGRRVVG